MTSESHPVEELLSEAKLVEFTTGALNVVDRDTPVATAVERLRDDRSGSAVLVIEPGSDPPRLVGIFTERDYLDRLAGETPTDDATVERYMTASPQTLPTSSTVGSAIRLMTSGGYRHLPVVGEDGRLAGLVSTRDIVSFLAEHFPTEVFNLPPRKNQENEIDSREGG